MIARLTLLGTSTLMSGAAFAATPLALQAVPGQSAPLSPAQSVAAPPAAPQDVPAETGSDAAVAARYPAVAQAFWRDCTVDAIVAAEWIANVGRRDARTRLAHLICDNRRAGGGDQTACFILPSRDRRRCLRMAAAHPSRNPRCF